jgi:hypothetical protein
VKLARNEPKNAQQVCAAVAIHGDQLLSMIIRNLCAGMQVASWWKAVENRGEMAQKWGILLRRYIQSNAETYIALANHTRPENPTLRFSSVC